MKLDEKYVIKLLHVLEEKIGPVNVNGEDALRGILRDIKHILSDVDLVYKPGDSSQSVLIGNEADGGL